MTDLDLAYKSAGEVAALIAGGRLSPVEAVSNAIERIGEVNEALNCFCFVWDTEALADADKCASKLTSGEPLGPLAGVPVALKDTTPTAGHRTTLGSVTHEHWVPDTDAYIVGAMRRAGAIIVGKTTSPEFAYASFTDSPLWGPTRNPWDPSRTPGGSSGGSAVAVATGCVPLAEGTDIGGSVRIPAAWCGIVGLKPGLGRIPMNTLPGLFDSISHHGPLARSVADARLFLAAAQGPDDADILSLPVPLDLSRPLNESVAGMRFALSVDLGCWAVDPAVEREVRKAAAALEDAGAIVEEVDAGFTARDDEMWLELWAVFMAAYFGHLVDEYGERMDHNVMDLIRRGNEISAVEYKRFELERTDLWKRMQKVLTGRDALLCATMPTGPLPAAEADQPPMVISSDGRHHGVDMTAVFNLVSPCPALSVPCGFDDGGLPVGLQIIGHRWHDDTVLQVGRAVELALPNAYRRPPAWA